MMESNSENQNELLQQLKKLRAEKELLEKHVFVLNECLSVDELKTKISDLEKKKEMLLSLENMIGRLRAEIEPLKYLKSILENKLINENRTNEDNSEPCIDLESSINKLNREFFNWQTECKTQQTQNLHTDSTKTDLLQSQKLYDEDTNQLTTSNSNSMSIINDGSIDECVQFLDQYDVVTNQEIINFSNESCSNTQNIKQDSSTSIIDNIDNEVQDNKTATIRTNVVDDIDTQLKNEESVPVKEELDLGIESIMNNLFPCDPKNRINHGASTSHSTQCNNFHSKSTANIADLLSKIPRFLLKHGIDQIEDEQISKESQNNVNVSLNEHVKHNETTDNEEDLNLFVENKDHSESIEPSENINGRHLGISTFNAMNLKLSILRGIYSLGLIRPTVLQERVIPHILYGRDMVVFARPGNGRTVMFIIALLQRIKTNFNDCQALVLVPTIEIASHIQNIIMRIGDFLDINVCIGGENVPKKLSAVPHIIVGTPAEVSSMITWNSLNIGFINTIVLYKADQMLDLNDTKLIKGILGKIKTKQVTLLASEKLDHLLDTYMDSLNDPMIIIKDEEEKFNERNATIKNFPKQFYLNIQEDWKINALCEIIETLKIEQGIIFCNTMYKAKNLFNYLQDLKYAVTIFDMGLSGPLCEKNLYKLPSNSLKIIITTDPVGGCQFTQVAWLINYDFPNTGSCYLDRMSHCKGNIKVLNLINENDIQSKNNIESTYNFRMIQVPLNMTDLLQF